MTILPHDTAEKPSALPSALQRLAVWIAFPLAAIAVAVAIAAPLDLYGQITFGVATVAILILMRHKTSRRATHVLAVLSFIVSTRYIYWRATDTLSFDSPISTFLGVGLFMAELYAYLVMALGYLQFSWPLDRKPVPLPADVSSWPTVDVYIPTYNESLQVVGDTVLAALNMDYPREKMRVFLLDDGRREEFRAFADEVGCGYITRPDNKHAKAGNLNNALTRTNGDYVLIFDCDHVPTRAFLQLTLGWLVKDKAIALVQTPHHFYSPEPFQRNTPRGRELPSEGDLFYGVIQPGNDFWDAAYFCGSCAIIRRSALDEVGGFAGDTVTEDAHTALKMQKRGWKTAYINIPLAAGLATEKLALHIGQRIRWARGMTQILRLDNPLIGGKMTLAQRLCYLTAILHFQFPLSRLVFLTSPLAYLLLGEYVISASAAMILAYALPHLIHNMATNARLQGKFRHAFWGEIYEIALSFHLLLPTLVTLINPRRGKFNVTDKGGLLNRTYFDWRLVVPHMVVAGLLIGGVIFGFVRYSLFPGLFPIDRDTLLLNTAWSMFNLVLLFAAIGIAFETRQIRRHVRFTAEIPVTLQLTDGRSVDTRSVDISMGGLAARIPHDFPMRESSVVAVELYCGSRKVGFPVRVIQTSNKVATLSFEPMSLAERRDLVLAIMGRADAWAERGDHSKESILASWFNLLSLTFRLIASAFGRGPVDSPVADPARATSETPAAAQSRLASRAASFAAAVGLSTGLFAAEPAFAQARYLLDELSPVEDTGSIRPALRPVTYSLKAMGAQEPVRLTGTLGEAGFSFTLRQDEVVTSATLTLAFAYSPTLAPESAGLEISLNGEPLGTFTFNPEKAGGVSVDIPVNRAMFLTDNRLSFRFTSGAGTGCDEALDATHWTVISNTASSLALTVERFATTPALHRLPAPFFDAGDMGALTLPFVYARQPSESMVSASATVASFFGSLASYRGFHFPAAIGTLPEGDAIVFATVQDRIEGLPLPYIGGPTLAVVPNPNEPARALLLVLGRNAQEMQTAAYALVRGAHKAASSLATVSAPEPTKHEPYDAPRWLATGREIALGSIPDAALSLEGRGTSQGLLTANFRVPPDLFVWPRKGLPLNVHYRYPPAEWIDGKASRLDVLVNNTYLKSFSLEKPKTIFAGLPGFSAGPEEDSAFHRALIEIAPYYVFGQNQLQFYFDLKAKQDGSCAADKLELVRTAIEPDTTLDLSNVHHFAEMPNLAFFASAGFPFTRMADLSETLVYLGAAPDGATLSAFLDLMGRFGDATGAPVHGLTVTREVTPEIMKDRDVLIIGPASTLADQAQLAGNAPIRLEKSTVKLKPEGALSRTLARVYTNKEMRARKAAHRALLVDDAFAGMVSFRSPVSAERVVVGLLATETGDLPGIVQDLAERSRNEKVQGNLSLWTENGISSFSVGPSFWMGELPPVKHLYWLAARHPLLMALIAFLSAVALSAPLFWALRRRASQRLQDGE